MFLAFFFPALVVTREFSVSGISSGAFMAVQLDVAYSSDCVGAGIVAGGPYYCAVNDIALATTICMNQPWLLSPLTSINEAIYQESILTIDRTVNMKDHKIWLFSGEQDSVVHQGVVKVAQQFYSHFVDAQNIKTEYSIPAEHSFVTDDFGSSCNYLGSPYINDCQYDSAQEILTHIYGNLNPKVDQIPTNLISFDQSKYINFIGSSMKPLGYIYYPTNCQVSSDKCKIHVALHGCEQDYEKIGNNFVKNAGYNSWAEANDIIVIYPQVGNSLLNPKGCWDWWGYTGIFYAVKSGIQTSAIYNMTQNLPEFSKISFTQQQLAYYLNFVVHAYNYQNNICYTFQIFSCTQQSN